MLAIPVNRARIISVRRRGRVCHELERWNPLCCLESHLSVHNSRLCHLQVRFQDRVGLHHSLADLGFLRDLHLAEASWGAEWVDLGLLPDVALLPMIYPEGVARGQTLRCDQ
jgi:hypothetical protein